MTDKETLRKSFISNRTVQIIFSQIMGKFEWTKEINEAEIDTTVLGILVNNFEFVPQKIVNKKKQYTIFVNKCRDDCCIEFLYNQKNMAVRQFDIQSFSPKLQNSQGNATASIADFLTPINAKSGERVALSTKTKPNQDILAPNSQVFPITPMVSKVPLPPFTNPDILPEKLHKSPTKIAEQQVQSFKLPDYQIKESGKLPLMLNHKNTKQQSDPPQKIKSGSVQNYQSNTQLITFEKMYFIAKLRKSDTVILLKTPIEIINIKYIPVQYYYGMNITDNNNSIIINDTEYFINPGNYNIKTLLNEINLVLHDMGIFFSKKHGLITVNMNKEYIIKSNNLVKQLGFVEDIVDPYVIAVINYNIDNTILIKIKDIEKEFILNQPIKYCNINKKCNQFGFTITDINNNIYNIPVNWNLIFEIEFNTI